MKKFLILAFMLVSFNALSQVTFYKGYYYEDEIGKSEVFNRPVAVIEDDSIATVFISYTDDLEQRVEVEYKLIKNQGKTLYYGSLPISFESLVRHKKKHFILSSVGANIVFVR